jgi:hypothetical protein
VSGESAQEVLAALMPQVREVPVRQAQDGSDATSFHYAPVRDESGADGASLGIVCIEVDEAVL